MNECNDTYARATERLRVLAEAGAVLASSLEYEATLQRVAHLVMPALADWQPAHLITGDVVPQIRRLKEQDGPELQVHGSSKLLQTLIKHELVDRYNLMMFPLLLGRGKRLFGDGALPAGLRLVNSTTSTTGVILATYEPPGAITPGSFALAQPTQ